MKVRAVAVRLECACRRGVRPGNPAAAKEKAMEPTRRGSRRAVLSRVLLGSAALAGLVAVVWLLAPSPTQAAGPSSCGPPPRARPHRRTGGESFPPLPLPITPLRRSERQREPSPPALVSKMAYGPIKWAVRNGQRYSYRDWKTDPADMSNLLRWVNARLGIRYRSVESQFGTFSYDPTETPILYFTGHQAIGDVPDETVAKLRRFALDGGTILGDACCGSKEFTAGFRKLMARVFPKRPLVVLDADDHPVFRAYHTVRNCTYQMGQRRMVTNVPYLEGINVGCRTAVFFTPIDMSCGWDGHTHHDNPERKAYSIRDARRIGANLLTYVLANYQLGRFLATTKQYYQSTQEVRDRLVIGQIVHGGDWDPNPDALPNLMKYLRENSTVHVQFKRADVQLATARTFDYPLLYQVGHRDFTFSAPEVKNLRKYLDSGGVLLAEACCGRRAFDRAFRREIKKVYPDAKLEVLPDDHPLYKTVFDTTKVQYTALTDQEYGKLAQPTLEGIIRDGQLVVIYSRFALGNGWEEFDHPYSRGYASTDALRLGTNVVVYAMTH
jgi:hypothetical protein